MSVHSTWIYGFTATPFKILASYFVDTDKLDSQVYMEKRKTQKSQHNIEEQNWRNDNT